jgi:hypothetical protein
MGRGPAPEPTERPAAGRPERDELRVLDPPAPGDLLDDELRVEEQVDLGGAELGSQLERPDEPGVLGDVVRLDAQVVGDGGVRRRARVASIGPAQVVERGPGRCRPWVAASRAVGPDDEATAGSGRIRRARPGRGRPAEVAEQGPVVGGQGRRPTIALLTSRIAWVISMPRGQASVQLKIVRQRHTPSSSARISRRSSA